MPCEINSLYLLRTKHICYYANSVVYKKDRENTYRYKIKNQK